MNRAADWLHQAEEDFLWAKDTYNSNRFSQACFVCQQCGEKALKALSLSRGFERVKSHFILDIARALEINSEIEEAAKRLDLYYISTRYPDALPSGALFEFFTKAQAEEALDFVRKILQVVRDEMRS
ncbi:MAG: HEPN domain-containing protein [Deltaproteobacteria bacterium]|nr:HEPN domain-containing protein [Deltaproteobacteria bacterium]